MPVALMTVIGVVYASQLVLTGHATSWAAALGTELAFWFAWGIVALLIFRLCRFLHTGPPRWQRYALGFVLGAAGTTMAFPALFQTIMFAARGIARAFSFPAPDEFAFWPTVRGTTVNLIGPTMILYVGTVLGWYAVIFYRDLKERKLKAVELESLLHQAQLEALRSQLHPHFLFNTLHSIAELVHENPALAEQLILRLADLLRNALKTPAPQEVPLGDEIEFTRAYLQIEQMRLGDRLTIEWDVAPETLAARVPSLVLQPLVENAIHHGIAPFARPGRLSIRAHRNQGFLHLEIRDTGPGLPAAAAGIGNGIGLANTESRLKRLYGEQHQFELVNDHGLIVKVRIPFAASENAPAESP